MRALLLALLVACTAEPTETTPEPPAWPEGTWNPRMPDAATQIAPLRDLVHRRSVVHLHSPYSHDACDSHGWVDGALDTACRDDLRRALCDDRYDVAFITDHPDYGDAQEFEAMFHPAEGDRWVEDAQGRYALDVTCPDGHVVQWRAGFEDELMPISLHGHVSPDPVARHELLNSTAPEAFAAMQAAGGRVMLAHTEQRSREDLLAWQDLGLHGVEAFNVHAMFSPNIRQEALGLDPTAWITDIAPFTADGATAAPDLLFLAVHQEQTVSVEHWDALLQRGPMMATAGADSHQNVLSFALSDGERVDSYRRGLRWFTTILQARGTDAAAIDEALTARRAFIAFEALGTPTGFDLHLEDDAGGVWEMGSDAPGGRLTVSCPTLADESPYGPRAPEISVIVYRDGEPWQTSCGTWDVEPGVYRARVDITPWHLEPFLSGATHLLKSYPWVYSGAIRVGMP